MLKLTKSRKSEKGFTLIELLVVAAIIGILLAIAIPNLLKARLSANEASAKKMMQTLWVAEGEYYEQDLNGMGGRDYTNLIGTNATDNSLRCPDTTIDCVANPEESLVDSSFEGAIVTAVGTAACPNPKAGYCIQFDPAITNFTADFGWEASMTSAHYVGRKDFAVYADKSMRCDLSTKGKGEIGEFEADRNDPGCD